MAWTPRATEVFCAFSETCKGHAAENFSRLRRIGLNLLRRETTGKAGIKSKRLLAGWDNAYLLGLLAG